VTTLDDPPLLTHAEAAILIGVSRRTLRRWREKGHIEKAPTPGLPRYRLADVMKLKGQLIVETTRAHPETKAQRHKRGLAALRAFSPAAARRLAAV
jgi:excisionase family DNA binding protein